MNNRFPIGWNVDGTDLRPHLRDNNNAALWSHYDKLQPACTLVMDNAGLAHEMKAKYPDMTVTSRSWSAHEGGEWQRESPTMMANRLAKTANKNILKYLTNEPGFNADTAQAWAKHEADTLGLLRAMGHKAVAFNTSVGSYQLEWVKSGAFDTLIRAVIDGGHYFGCHEYQTLTLFAGFMSPEAWLDKNKMQEPWPDVTIEPDYEGYWLLYRHAWIVKRALDLGYSMSDLDNKFLLTEWGYDNTRDPNNHALTKVIDELRETYGMQRYNYDMRGVNTYETYRQAMFGSDTNTQIIKEFKWNLERLPSWILGVCLFAINHDWEYPSQGFPLGNDKESGHDYSIEWRWFEFAGRLEALADTWRQGELNVPDVPDVPDVPEPPIIDTTTYDMLDYLRGDGRNYRVAYDFPGGLGAGVEMHQTLTAPENRNVFYQIKGAPHSLRYNWEEMWGDDMFIWRGTDTSPNNDELYQVFSVDNTYGARWFFRKARIGDKYYTQTKIVFKQKTNGDLIANKPEYIFPHWIEFTKHYNTLTLRGVTIPDVIQLSGYLHDPINDAPGELFERYYYAKNYGLIGWEDPNKGWISFLETLDFNTETVLPRTTYDWLETKVDQHNTPNAEEYIFPMFIESASSQWGTNVRASNTVESDKIALINEKRLIYMNADISDFASNLGVWYSILINGSIGWVRSDVVIFSHEATTPPINDTNTKTMNIVYNIKNPKQVSIISLIEELINITDFDAIE